MTTNTVQVTPFFGVSNLETAVAFYRDKLGFEPWVVMDGYAYLDREGAGIRLLVHSRDDGRLEGGRCYIDVHDVDAVVRRHSHSWVGLPAESVHGPVDQDYEQREVFIKDPDGNLVIFGQGIGGNASQWKQRDV